MSKNPLTEGQTSMPAQQQMPDINALYSQFKKDPVEFLLRSRLNIPRSVGSDPQAIFNHLMQSGQVPKQLMPQIQRMMPKSNINIMR